MNNEKLSLANHKVYFKALKIWAITRGVLWAFNNTLESIQKRKVIEKDKKQFVFTTILSKLIKNLNNDNRILLETLDEPYKIYNKLLSKYTDRSPAKNEKLKLEFHTYKLKHDESI